MEIHALVPPPNAKEDKVFIVPITSHILERLTGSLCLYISVVLRKLSVAANALKKEKRMLTLDSKVPQRLKTQF